MEIQEYLLSYGCLGDFGRFRPFQPLVCQRGDRAVVRSHRGLELASVLCPARPGHARFLPNTSLGQLLRLANEEDERTAEQMRLRSQRVFEDAAGLAVELGLPLQVVDVEVLLDGEHGVIHLLRAGECDVRPFVSRLSRRHDLHITLQDLTRPAGAAEQDPEETEEHGCGRPGCGRVAGGGCSICGSGGGCSTCGIAGRDLKAYFLELRQKMEQQRRHALL
ncbi:MAG TPA: PSP1 C-terminal domain-containing protein [Gemmataceae bacterium]|nr:PSP1 C-terminal domain-containing protein [Gemmataceae bacterium]